MDIHSNNDKEISPINAFLNILFRRGWYVLACMIAVMIPVLYYNATATRVYEASTTVIYEESRSSVASSQPQYYTPMKETLLNQIQEIKSRSVSREVVKALPQHILQKLPVPKKVDENFNPDYYYAALVKSNVDAVPVAESNVIEIKVRASEDPIVATTLANTLTNVLQERNQRIRREEVSGVRAFIEEQQQDYKQRLNEAEATLREFKVNNRVTSLDKEVEETLQRATHIELMYQEARNELEKTQEMYTSLSEKISAQQKNLAPSIADMTTQNVQQLKAQLGELQDAYIRLQLQGIPENNSKMVQMRNDMERVQMSLAEEARKFAEAENVIDPVSRIATLYEQKVQLELKLQTLRTQVTSLREALDGYERNLSRLPVKESQLARLTRERDLANTIYLMLSERREEARISEAEKIGNMRVIDMAQLPESPVLPRKMLNLAIGLMVGLTIGLGLAFFLESLDTSLKTPEDIEKRTGLTVIGSIPRIRLSPQSKEEKESSVNRRGSPSVLVAHTMQASPASEAYRTLRTNLQFSDLAENVRTFMVTSSGPKEGKSTTAANIAVTTAQMGLRTLVIDADLRRPTIHRIFGVNREPGLADILMNFHYNKPTNGGAQKQPVHVTEETSEMESGGKLHIRRASDSANKALHQMVSLDLSIAAATHKTAIDKLEVLTCGYLPPNPSELLASETMKDLMVLVKEKYEFVVIDAPPVIAVTDAAVLAPQVDAAALVVESGRNDREIILKAKSLLDRVGVNLLGAILNNVRERNLYGDYDYYYTYYSFNSTSDNGRSKRSKT